MNPMDAETRKSLNELMADLRSHKVQRFELDGLVIHFDPSAFEPEPLAPTEAEQKPKNPYFEEP